MWRGAFSGHEYIYNMRQKESKAHTSKLAKSPPARVVSFGDYYFRAHVDLGKPLFGALVVEESA